MFNRVSRFQLLLIFLALVTLRVSVGYHFFKEGVNKLHSGKFTSEYFLRGARGPLAPMFNGMVEDVDGSQRLCVVKVENEETGQSHFDIDPTLTISIWNDYIDRASSYYGLGSEELIANLQEREVEMAADDDEEDSLVTIDAEIKAIKNQTKQREEIFDIHVAELKDWLRGNRVPLLAHFETGSRLDGFNRDGANRHDVSVYVDSLRGQVDKIRSDREKELAGWKKEIGTLWDSFEQQVQELAVGDQARRAPLPLHRPFDQPMSRLAVIDKILPWFDTIVGALLILGLFTRFASLAAAVFLFVGRVDPAPVDSRNDTDVLSSHRIGSVPCSIRRWCRADGWSRLFFGLHSRRTSCRRDDRPDHLEIFFVLIRRSALKFSGSFPLTQNINGYDHE